MMASIDQDLTLCFILFYFKGLLHCLFYLSSIHSGTGKHQTIG